MRIFISWSGEPSRSVARALNGWLGLVVQHVQPWMSEEEIRSGTRWNDTVAKALDEANFGIVCVTRANQEAPWLMFEAGALAKRLDVSFLVPLCIDLPPSEITSPLQAFQGRVLSKDGVRQLVTELSESAPQARPRDISRLFEAMWPDLEAAIEGAMRTAVPSPKRLRSQEDMLDELITRTRDLERQIEQGAGMPSSTVRQMDRLESIAYMLRASMQRTSDLGEVAQMLLTASERLERIAIGGGLKADRPAEDDHPEAPDRSDSDSFEVGEIVRHHSYGEGVVRELDGLDSSRRIKIAFADQVMWLSLRQVALEKTGRRDRTEPV